MYVGALRMSTTGVPVITDGTSIYGLHTSDEKIIQAIFDKLSTTPAPCVGIKGYIDGVAIVVEEIYL